MQPAPTVSDGLGRTAAAELASRAAAIRARPLGRTLDLSTHGVGLAAPGGGSTVAIEGDDASFDSVVSVFELVRFPDLPAVVGELGRLLRPGGEMWLLEPIGRPGLAAAVLCWLWSADPRLAGLQLGRDIPAAVRDAGLWVTDVERFDMQGAPWPLRPFVQLRATWVVPGEEQGRAPRSKEEQGR